MYKTFDTNKAEKVYLIDVYNKELIVTKVKTGRWLLVDIDGSVVSSRTSETSILKDAERLENRRARGNAMGFRFGSKIEANDVKRYAHIAWGKVFELENVEFDGHYWWTDMIHKATGERATRLRADYHINYLRAPDGMEEFEDVVICKNCK